VDFRHFFAVDGGTIPQRAKRIEAKPNVRLLDLPRSEVQRLPSGQDVRGRAPGGLTAAQGIAVN
jgi:hypothetical protein